MCMCVCHTCGCIAQCKENYLFVLERLSVFADLTVLRTEYESNLYAEVIFFDEASPFLTVFCDV